MVSEVGPLIANNLSSSGILRTARARHVAGAVAQAERHQAGRQAGLDANFFVGLGVKGDEVGANRRNLGEDRHHPVVGGEGRLDRGNAGLVGGEGVSQRRRGRLDGSLIMALT